MLPPCVRFPQAVGGRRFRLDGDRQDPASMTDENGVSASDRAVTSEPAQRPTLPLQPFRLLRLVRTAIAGVLMGIANLIPGVSAGTTSPLPMRSVRAAESSASLLSTARRASGGAPSGSGPLRHEISGNVEIAAHVVRMRPRRIMEPTIALQIEVSKPRRLRGAPRLTAPHTRRAAPHAADQALRTSSSRPRAYR